MTAVLAVHAGDFVLLGADGRGANDDVGKITATPFGLITGAGSLGFVTAVARQMKTSADPSALPSAIDQALQFLQTEFPEHVDQVRQATSWIMSRRQGDELMLETYHPFNDYAPMRIDRGGFELLLPGDVPADLVHALHLAIDQNLPAMLGIQESFSAKAERLAGLMQVVAQRAADATAGVDRAFQIGVHLITGVTQVTDLITSIDECTWRPAVRDDL